MIVCHIASAFNHIVMNVHLFLSMYVCLTQFKHLVIFIHKINAIKTNKNFIEMNEVPFFALNISLMKEKVSIVPVNLFSKIFQLNKTQV